MREGYLLACVAGLAGVCLGAERPPNSHRMKIHNEAPYTIMAYWISVNDGSLVRQFSSPLQPNFTSTINTYTSHAFVFTKWTGSPDAKVSPEMPRHAHTGVEESVFVFEDAESGKLTVKMKDRTVFAREEAQEIMAPCDALDSVDEYKRCAQDHVSRKMAAIAERQELAGDISDGISGHMRNYTCADLSAKETEPKHWETWVSQTGNQRVDVGLLLNSSHATIRRNRNFLSAEECRALIDTATPGLQRASTADNDGGDQITFSRRADQKGVPYDRRSAKAGKESLINDIYDRLFEYVNYYTPYDLKLEGQESITAIRYKPSDEYHPHCDGACDGTKHRATGRVATMVMYCQMPPARGGGATTFTKANVLVRGSPGDAIFFSYLGEDGKMDDGLTEHSGCPVTDGEKFIATMWFRKGVDATAQHYMHDPQGRKKPQFRT